MEEQFREIESESSQEPTPPQEPEVEVPEPSVEEAKVEESIVFLNKKLLNEDFLKRAPKEIILKEKEKYEECLKKKDRILENIKKLYEVGGKA